MDFSAYSVTLGGTDYPAKYAGLLAYMQSNLAAVTGDASGNVGLGNASPVARLTIGATDVSAGLKDTALFAAASTDTSQFRLLMNWAGTGYLGIGAAVGSNAMIFGQASSSTGQIQATWMRLESSGTLLLGTNSQIAGNSSRAVIDYPSSDFIANLRNTHSTVPYGLKVQFSASPNNASSPFIYCNDGTAQRFIVNSNGSAQNTTGVYGAFSDLKLKVDIADCTPKLADLMRVRIVNYRLKSDPEAKLIGVVAQELEQVFPGLVESTPDFREVTKTRLVEVPAVHDDHGIEVKPASFIEESFVEREATGTVTKSVKYSVFVPILVKAVQELTSKVNAQAARISELEARP